ncbi:hypothetical protein RND81_04G050700 [Saponaria officinalis]|uniref:Uncharacterized protein n=1 Tax=Saponaria officinalis TaxID=3572 RepID=A0AAW1LCN6_SAPOF
MCCPGKVCMLCTCLILVVIAIGLVFGFGVFKNGFHKLKHTMDLDHHNGRPFIAYNAPSPYFH